MSSAVDDMREAASRKEALLRDAGAYEPLKAPIVLHGNGDLLCAYWYDCLWEIFHPSSRIFANKDEASAYAEELSFYIAAVSIIRWAREADMDVSSALEAEVVKIIDNTLVRQPLPQVPVFASHNDDDNAFGTGDVLSTWASRRAMSAVNHTATRASTLGSAGLSGVYSREEGQKPVLEAPALDAVFEEVRATMWPLSLISQNGMWALLLPDVRDCIGALDLNDAFLENVGDEVEALALGAQGPGYRLVECAPETAVIATSPAATVDDEYGLTDLAITTAALGLLPDGVRHVLLLGTGNTSASLSIARQAMSRLGAPVLYDLSGVFGDVPVFLDQDFTMLDVSSLVPRDRFTRCMEFTGELTEERLHIFDAALTRSWARAIFFKTAPDYCTLPQEHELEDAAIAKAILDLSFGEVDVAPAITLAREVLGSASSIVSNRISELAENLLASYPEKLPLSKEMSNIEAAYSAFGISGATEPVAVVPHADAFPAIARKGRELGIDSILEYARRGIPIEDLLRGFGSKGQSLL